MPDYQLVVSRCTNQVLKVLSHLQIALHIARERQGMRSRMRSVEALPRNKSKRTLCFLEHEQRERHAAQPRGATTGGWGSESAPPTVQPAHFPAACQSRHRMHASLVSSFSGLGMQHASDGCTHPPTTAGGCRADFGAATCPFRSFGGLDGSINSASQLLHCDMGAVRKS